MFKIDSTAELTNANSRQEIHGDENVLAFDLKFSVSLPVEDLIELFGTDVNLDEFKKLYWHESSHRLIAGFGLVTKFETKLDNLEFNLFEKFVDKPSDVLFCDKAVSLKGLVVEFADGCNFSTTFTIQVSNVNKNHAGLFCTLQKTNVYIKVSENQMQLALEEANAGDTKAEDALDDALLQVGKSANHEPSLTSVK